MEGVQTSRLPALTERKTRVETIPTRRAENFIVDKREDR